MHTQRAGLSACVEWMSTQDRLQLTRLGTAILSPELERVIVSTEAGCRPVELTVSWRSARGSASALLVGPTDRLEPATPAALEEIAPRMFKVGVALIVPRMRVSAVRRAP